MNESTFTNQLISLIKSINETLLTRTNTQDIIKYISIMRSKLINIISICIDQLTYLDALEQTLKEEETPK